MEQNKTNIEMEIILLLIKNPSHLRKMARALKSPHSTVLRKADELAKRGILDYSTQGKNKVFSVKKSLAARNYVYSAEIYKLSMLIRENPWLGVVLEDIKKKDPKGMIILFGSYAKGTEKKGSDIDIYIEASGAKRGVQMIDSRLSVKTGAFDINSPLIREIIKNHVIIRGLEDFYEKTGFFKAA